MQNGTFDLIANVTHALDIYPPDYVRSILGDPASWSTETCRPTELKLASIDELSKAIPALAHILIPAVPWKVPGVSLPFSDLLFRPSTVFRYPSRCGVPDPTPSERWFFINGICTDHNVVLINAGYLHELFGRPLTVIHNFTRGIVSDLAACAVGKEWDQVTESAAVAFPVIYAALKDQHCERLVLLAHSGGTILAAVVLALLKELLPRPAGKALKVQVPTSPECAVARKLAKRWSFERVTAPPAMRSAPQPEMVTEFEWPGYGRRDPEPISADELGKLEMYCFANCASEMVTVKDARGRAVPWIESYGNEMDIVARLGVLANSGGPGSVRISGDRYVRRDAWGHLLNAHYLYEMEMAAGGLEPLEGNQHSRPQIVKYFRRGRRRNRANGRGR